MQTLSDLFRSESQSLFLAIFRFSRINVRKENVSSSDEDEEVRLGGRKDSLLQLETSVRDSDADDHNAIKEHMRRITSLGGYKCLMSKCLILTGLGQCLGTNLRAGLYQWSWIVKL